MYCENIKFKPPGFLLDPNRDFNTTMAERVHLFQIYFTQLLIQLKIVSVMRILVSNLQLGIKGARAPANAHPSKMMDTWKSRKEFQKHTKHSVEESRK